MNNASNLSEKNKSFPATLMNVMFSNFAVVDRLVRSILRGSVVQRDNSDFHG